MKKRTRYTLRKPKDYRMVIFLTLLCVFLILLILYTQGKMRILQDFIARQTTKEKGSDTRGGPGYAGGNALFFGSSHCTYG